MKIIFITGGSLLVLLGAISWMTPLPGGTAMLAIGITMLICASERVARLVARSREKINMVNKALTWIEDHVPTKFGDVLRRTRPGIE